MQPKLKLGIISLVLVVNSFSFAMENSKKVSVLAIPGQNGLGSETWYVKEVLGDNIEVKSVETPAMPDLGQNNCIKYLRSAVANNFAQKCIVHCTSQGTATALNFLATENQREKISALIIEASLASGNSAIYHTAQGPLMNLRTIANLPKSYYWMPYFAKFLFPSYWPSGKQPIKLVQDMPNHVPIIIIHSKNDPQLSYQDALALYYGLKANHHPVYLIRKEGTAHINILEGDDESKKMIRRILKNHGLPTDLNTQPGDVKDAQPDHRQFANAYHELIRKEENHVRLGYALMAGTVALLAKFSLSIYHKILSSGIIAKFKSK